jgi:hypothetical protein
MPFLGDLGIVEGLAWGLEISAAILTVGVEEQCIKLAVEIVVMRDIAQRPFRRIELTEPAVEVADQPLRARPQRRLAVAALRKHHRQHVCDRALLDDHRAVDIGLAKFELRIEQDAALRCTGGETDGDRLSAAVAEGKNRSACGRDPQIARMNKMSQCQPKKPFHRHLPHVN